MKVLIVSSNSVTDPYPVPPYGPCLVARHLEASHRVHVHDGIAGGGDVLSRAVEAFDPDVVGLGIRNIDDMDMVSRRSFVREMVEDFVGPVRATTHAPLVLGGSGFGIFPEDLLRLSGAEYGIVGDGGPTLLSLVDAIEAGGDPACVPGVRVGGRSTREGGPSRALPVSIGHSVLDGLVDWGPYRERGAYPILTKRGCDRGCIYCTYPGIDGVGSLPRTPGDVADEIERAADRLGRVTFEFVDSTFDDPPGHAEAICAEIERRRLGARLRTMGMNPAGASTGLFEAMRRAGFSQIDCTPDSASASVIESLAKGFTLDDLARAAGAIRATGMPTMWFFLFGGPGETRQTLDQSFDFIDREISAEDMVHVSAGIRIYPGTPLHGIAVRDGLVGSGESLLDPPRFYVSPALGSDGLIEILSMACSERPNCVPSWESRPDAAMMARAAALRSALGVDEPMFRTFLRMRRGG